MSPELQISLHPYIALPVGCSLPVCCLEYIRCQCTKFSVRTLVSQSMQLITIAMDMRLARVCKPAGRIAPIVALRDASGLSTLALSRLQPSQQAYCSIHYPQRLGGACPIDRHPGSVLVSKAVGVKSLILAPTLSVPLPLLLRGPDNSTHRRERSRSPQAN
ncbi:hypothetical protein L226DRAFT_233645 [Lentinus tigrinus ALCF2SS1-7]|uniref:uncharacterized protein n=1 Tax=Lentinus tigrinus ALCF2SS1-7 TaxID=1328758 RepID=UPI001165E66C|nr:hypothetical protein L226DRAFT_233645 [Lentinus tigrinus ALCF2SS1-7]